MGNAWSSMISASVFSSVRNISHLVERLACRRVRAALVAGREPDSESRAPSQLALDADGAVELLHDAFRNREPEPQSVAFGRDEVLEDGMQAVRRNARSSILYSDFHVIAASCRRDD